jgi:hypothetical protein
MSIEVLLYLSFDLSLYSKTCEQFNKINRFLVKFFLRELVGFVVFFFYSTLLSWSIKQCWLTRRVFLTCQVWFMAFESIFTYSKDRYNYLISFWPTKGYAWSKCIYYRWQKLLLPFFFFSLSISCCEYIYAQKETQEKVNAYDWSKCMLMLCSFVF